MKGWLNAPPSRGGGRPGLPLIDSWSRLLKEKKSLSRSEKLWSTRTVQVVSRIGLTVVNVKLLINWFLSVEVGSGMNLRMLPATVLMGTLLPAKGLRHCTPLIVCVVEGSK